MEKENKEILKGRPWKIQARFSTFEEADDLRNEIKNLEETTEVKVKYMPSTKSYVVKIRKQEEEKTKKKK